jgi:hypothetical protein
MIKRNRLMVIFALLLMFTFIGWTAAGQKKESTKQLVWEYKFAINANEGLCNQLGAEGWELAGYAINEGGNQFFYFKRAK